MSSQSIEKQRSLIIKSILLAEDSLEHCYFFKRAVKDINPEIIFTEVHDGDELMDLLESYIPDILFLDLNMPCRDGMKCIMEIRENSSYQHMPIVVFSISKEPASIQLAYELGANLYFIKPKGYSALLDALRSILQMDWSKPDLVREHYTEKKEYAVFNPY
jgi:CheY-like chemotaxis protein